MKLLFDFLPILLFFGSYKYADSHKDWALAFANGHFSGLVSGGQIAPDDAPILLATLVVIVATLAQVTWLLARGRKVDLMLWVSLGLVVVLGGATVWFHNDLFIRWKPTVLYWVMAAAFLVSQSVFGKNLLRALLGEQLQLPGFVWRRLNWAWVLFFALMGVLNLWIAFSFSRSTWVNFKAFGATGLMLAFTIGQGLYLGRYIEDEPAPGSNAKESGR
jgi:intracellular septation protein